MPVFSAIYQNEITYNLFIADDFKEIVDLMWLVFVWFWFCVHVCKSPIEWTSICLL